MTLNILQCTGQPHTAKNYLAQMSSVLAGIEKPWPRARGPYEEYNMLKLCALMAVCGLYEKGREPKMSWGGVRGGEGSCRNGTNKE